MLSQRVKINSERSCVGNYFSNKASQWYAELT